MGNISGKKCITAYKLEKSNIDDIRKTLEAPGQFLEITVRNLTTCSTRPMVNKKHVLWIEADKNESLELRMSDACSE